MRKTVSMARVRDFPRSSIHAARRVGFFTRLWLSPRRPDPEVVMVEGPQSHMARVGRCLGSSRWCVSH